MWLPGRTVLRDQGGVARSTQGTSYLDSITKHMHGQDGDRDELGIVHQAPRRDAFELMHLQTGISFVYPAS
ncbi:hypothetical protein MY3296_008957 [Beauveria thailandica]